jgi:hypothetical protein
MPSINSAAAAMSNMAPVRLKRTVPPAMSCESENNASTCFDATVKFCGN